jgi:nitrous oxidase accessory protein NosD
MSLIACMILSGASFQTPKTFDLTKVSSITSSGRVVSRPYSLPSVANEQGIGAGAISVQGNNIVVDFQGAVLRGSPADAEPDQRRGTGIFITGKNVTILNAKVHGYKVGLMARNAPGLRIINCDFSYNWKQRLASTLEKEDTGDWMSYHRNEKDEWLRYGAAIYLRKCDGFEVKGCRAIGGQNGLMLMESNRGRVWNNNFSFLSSLGIGMYLSSENRIMHNKVDWCVRGFSYGVYNRGQDSAGILIYEQSNKNIFAYNSVTHGGDGFFLWAGQTTMDTGKGGCNDNLLFGNDWSHAPTNGIEATFSRNNFVNNLIMECWHGIWGGYSYESKVIGNVFGYNTEAIAWEHGQDNVVVRNTFHRDNDGLFLWSNPNQDPNWVYAKVRDTRSRDWTIRDNVFSNTFANALRLRRSMNVAATNNVFDHVGNVVKDEGEVVNSRIEGNQLIPGSSLPPASSLNQGDVSDYDSRFTLSWLPNQSLKAPWNSDAKARVAKEAVPYTVSPMPGGMNPFLKKDQLRGWRYMLVDQWGPYDFKSPLLWPREAFALGGGVAIDANGKQVTGEPSKTQRFEILGPKGRWKLVSKEGYTSVSATEGVVPGFLDATIVGKQPNRTELVLEYVGGDTTDYRGIVTQAGKPVRFGHSLYQIPIDWTVKFYKWETQVDPSVATSNPVEADIRRIFAGEPLHTVRTDKLDYASGGAFASGLPTDKFATVAEGDLDIAPGEYVIELTTDDGSRVWLDGKEIITGAWKYQGPTQYTANVRLGGKHNLRVEHFEINGYAALKLKIRPK